MAAGEAMPLVKRTPSTTLYGCMFPESSDFSEEAPGLDIYARRLGISFQEQVLLVLDKPGRSRGGGSLEPSHPAGYFCQRECGDSGSQVAKA